MPLSFRRSLPITGAAVMMTGALALAQTRATPAPRIRPETNRATELLHDLVGQSRTAREIADALNDSDLLIYLRHRSFTATTLNGRTGFVRSDAPTRTDSPFRPHWSQNRKSGQRNDVRDGARAADRRADSPGAARRPSSPPRIRGCSPGRAKS